MTTRGNTARRPGVTILTKQELDDARAIAERLAIEVTRLLSTVDPKFRNAFALSRFLEVERTAVQRLLSGVATVDEGTLARAPGPKALSRIIDAFEPHGIPATIAAGFREVVSRLENYFDSTGGSQQAFVQRLFLTEQGGSAKGAEAGGQPPEVGRRIFEAACDVTRRWSDVQTQIAIIRPCPNSPGLLDVARARGLIGHVQNPGAMPLVFTHLYGTGTANAHKYRELRPTSSPPTYMLNEFCSPLWRLSSFIEDDSLIQPIEVDPRALGTPGDIVIGSASTASSKDPRTESPPVQEVIAAIDYPTRRFVLDVYLHEDLARRCKSGGDIHCPRQNDPGFVRQTHRRWMTRVGQPTQLSILGTGTTGADYPPYSQHRRVTESVFESMEWDPRMFVGFRLDVPYPVWRTCLRAFFTFE